ncbi:hypothetical protein RLW55_01565 [Hyphomicrobium sp. B1]|uniref:hypothetical protein n=1 Tax=Hyphomicrobium sp. B1 TaxID=3075651 RepID=UPI003C2C52E5
MLPDDVFRDRLEKTLVEIETSVARMRDYAAVEVIATTAYWRVVVLPIVPEACPFELLITSKQTFSLKLAEEAFEDLPVEHFELFPHLVRSIEAGHVEKISKFDAMTDELVAIEMRVALSPGWDWRGERRIAKAPPEEVWRTHRYLAYRR